MTTKTILIREEKSGLSVSAPLLFNKAPENAAFFWEYLATPRVVPAFMPSGRGLKSPAPFRRISLRALLTPSRCLRRMPR